MKNRRKTRNRLEKIKIQMIQKEKDKNLRENRDTLKTQIFIQPSLNNNESKKTYYKQAFNTNQEIK